tara:strand:- start:432 stop:632 length:201 start_codon:yes stop_codon:yes gene_type:complete
VRREERRRKKKKKEEEKKRRKKKKKSLKLFQLLFILFCYKRYKRTVQAKAQGRPKSHFISNLNFPS